LLFAKESSATVLIQLMKMAPKKRGKKQSKPPQPTIETAATNNIDDELRVVTPCNQSPRRDLDQQTYRNYWLFFLHHVAEPVLSKHFLGSTFGQRTRVASKMYKLLSESQIARLNECNTEQLPLLFDDLFEKESEDSQKKKLFLSIEYLFDMNSGKYQGEWWDATIVVKIVNYLAKLPDSLAYNPGQPAFKEADLLPAIREGLGSKHLIGNDFNDFEVESLKKYFTAKDRTREGTFYYLFVDKTETKTVPRLNLKDREQLEEIGLKEMNKQDFLPASTLEDVNWWYSVDAEKLFKPRENETTRDAAEIMVVLLRLAANDEGRMKELIENLDEEGEKALFEQHVRIGDIRENVSALREPLRGLFSFGMYL
jgi:hypothetical protein